MDKDVGLFKDAATARRGEGIFPFMFRSTFTEYKNAFQIEKNRLSKKGKSFFSFKNKFYIGIFTSICITVLIYFLGG